MNRNKPTYEELEKKIGDLNAENAKLAQSVFLFQSIFEKLPFGLQIFDKEGFSFKMNQALKKLLGLPNLDEGIGKFNVLTDKFTAANSKNKIYERVFKGEEFTHDIEYDFGDPDNQWNTRKDKVYFNETIFPVLNSKNKLEYVVALLRDITDLKHAEQQLLSDKEELNEKSTELENQNKKYRQINEYLQKEKDRAEDGEKRLRKSNEELNEIIQKEIGLEKRLEFALTSSHTGAWDLDLINQTAIRTLEHDRIFGYNTMLPEWTYEMFLEHVVEDDKAEVNQKFQYAISTKTDWNFECRIKRCDGEIRWILASGRHQPDEQGNVSRMAGIVQDITSRKESDIKIIGLSNIIKNSLNEIYIFDTKTLYFKFLNNSALNNLGYTADEIIRLTPLDIKPEFTYATFIKEVEPLLNGTKDIIRFETIHKRKNGTSYPVEIHLQISEFEGEKCFTAIVTDITERKRIQRELTHSFDLMRYIIEHNRSAVAVLDKNLRYIFVSQRYVHDYKIKENDIVGRHHYEIFPDLPQRWKDVHQEALNGQIIKEEEDAFPRENGTVDWNRWECRPWYEASGEIGGIILYTEVITERKKMEEALIQKNKELEASQEEISATNEELVAMANALKESYSELKVAKENAEASELQFRLLVENAPEPIYIQIDAKFDYLNKAAINLYGADSDEKLLGTSIEERIHPDYIDLVKHSINQLNVDKNPVNNIQIKHLTLDNNPIEVEVSAVPIKFNNKDGALVFVKDITERKEYELKLQRSFDLLKNLTAQVPGVVYQYRLYPDGRSAFPYSSPGMYEIYEVTSEDVREDASAVFTRLHPDDLQFIVDTIMESARNQTIYHSEFRVILPKQGIRWRQCDAKPELLGDGSTLWHGIISDITERKQAEEKIKEQQLLFETMFNTITDGVIITNTERRILHANSGMQTTFGYLPGEIIGEPIEIIYADSDKYLKTGEDVYNESPLNSDNFYMTSYKDKFNNIFPGETFGAKLYDSNGEWIGNLGIIRNISERVKYIEELKIAREKAEVSDNLKTAFLHNISHEIRTPMNAIIGFSELLVLPKRNPEKNKLYADIIIQSANQLLSIIDDIINLATIEAGQVKLQKSKFELNATLKYIYQQFVLKARNQNIGFYFNTGLSDDFCLHTDKTKFTEILINLIGNAIKFTKRGEVSFGYQQKGNEVEFYVIDTGIGIPLEMHEEIFKRFRQVETAESRQFGGTGLGLSISKAYVELLSGKIWLKSEPGKGSSFFFTIPFEQVTMDNLIEASDDEGMELKFEQPKSILIAEDEDSNFTLLEELLSVANLKIFRATNGVEAIEIFKSNAPIDLVLMDIKMPLKDGYEAIKEIKTIDPDIPIIAQTAYSNEADMKKAISAGCIDTLAKPIDRNRLIAMLKKHLK